MERLKPLILIVDDVPENIQVLIQILESESYRFAIATNAEETYSAVEAEIPDLILLDIILPQINGYEICENLKANPLFSDIPIVFLTVLDDTEDILKGFKLGAVDYITKPFNEYEVLARVKTQLKLMETQKALISSNNTKDRLFSIIAHELKNPFNNIINFLDILKRNFKTFEVDRTEKILDAAYSDSIRITELLENLLLWSRAQTNNINVSKNEINLHQLVIENFDLLSESAERKNITLVNNVPENIVCKADGNMISMVIRNLLSNAIKFTSSGKITCTTKSEGEKVRVSVKDSGIGIKSDNLKKLFRNDVSLSTKGTMNETGTGLGLMLCKEFIEKNEGEIWVESKLGSGSTFHFTLLKA